MGEDREIAALMGINVDPTIVTTFAIGGALAGAAGILYVLLFNQVLFTRGSSLGSRHLPQPCSGGSGASPEPPSGG